jgi:hypothetical protein
VRRPRGYCRIVYEFQLSLKVCRSPEEPYVFSLRPCFSRHFGPWASHIVSFGPRSRFEEIPTLFAANEYQKSDESRSIRRPAHARWVKTWSDLNDDHLQTSWRSCNSVNDNRDPGHGTASCPRTGHAGFLRELGRWIPRYPDNACLVVGTRFVRERASETFVGEALRPRAQDVKACICIGRFRRYRWWVGRTLSWL